MVGWQEKYLRCSKVWYKINTKTFETMTLIHPFFSSFLSLSLVIFFSFYYMHNTWLVDVFIASELVLPCLIFVVEDAFTASMSSLLTSSFVPLDPYH